MIHYFEGNITEMNEELEKITFRLEIIDGYPPVGFESLWCEKIGERLYKIRNIPFYAKGISMEDIISVIDDKGELFFESLFSASGNSSIRVIVLDDDILADVNMYFKVLKYDYEESEDVFFIAINIPEKKNPNDLFNYLDSMEKKKKLEYEIGNLNPIHDI